MAEAAPLTPAPRRRPSRRPRRQIMALTAAAVLAAAVLAVGLDMATDRPPVPGGDTSAAQSPPSTPATLYYRQVMERFTGSAGTDHAGSYWLSGTAGYRWMMGGVAAPGWMSGGSLPGFMLESGTDPGSVMGRLFATAPGARVPPAQAAMMGSGVPAGASVDRAANQLIFDGPTVYLDLVAGAPTRGSAGPEGTFSVAGMVDPTVVVPAGAEVTITLVNADWGAAHGLVVTAPAAAVRAAPMAGAPPAFAGAAVWFLGEATAAGGMNGTLVVAS